MMESGWAAADFDLSPLAPPKNSRPVGAGGQEHSQGAEDKVGAAWQGTEQQGRSGGSRRPSSTCACSAVRERPRGAAEGALE